MLTVYPEAPSDEQSRVVRDIMKHLAETPENVVFGAVTVALSMINAEWPTDSDEEDILYSSCYQLFSYTLALASALCDEARITEFWEKASELSVKLYGKERTDAAKADAWKEYRGAIDRVAKERRSLNLQ